MAGTDKTQESRPALSTRSPAIVLIDPQLGMNIGMVARAMLNCGLTDLRLVRPRDGWPNAEAVAASSGAGPVVEAARLYQTTAEAIADLRRVFATTVRPRGMVKPVVTPRAAAMELRAGHAAGEACGILFGPERSGLVNDDLALADTVVSVPLNPAFGSLNLAQAVLLIGYEWYLAGDSTPPRQLETGEAGLALKGELVNFFQRLEALLDESGFLFPVEKRPTMVRNIRNIFQRTALTESELRTLHGILSALWKGRSRDEPGS